MKPTKIQLLCLALCSGLWFTPQIHGAPLGPASTNELEELTSPELRQRIESGSTTALIPLGGTEQNGAHMVLGKHNVRVRLLAEMIAQQVGNTIVTPVMAYVPEGDINPPTAHMRYTGTLTIPPQVFEGLLQATVQSLAQQGFRRVILLGDHGGYQTLIQNIARRLNQGPMKHTSCRAYALSEYFEAQDQTFAQDLKARGFSAAQIGTHAGLLDTSLTLALDPALVRAEELAAARPDHPKGVHGDPRQASAALGRIGVERIVGASVAAIRALPQ